MQFNPLTPNEIYEKLNIMPSIREHQKTVAAISLKICDSLSKKVNSDLIVTTCLLHDLGNILKGTKNFAPKGEEEYWEKVKEETKVKYGESTDEATVNMIKSLKLSNEDLILEHLSWIGGRNLSNKTNEDLKNLEFVIAPYADSRVSPEGVVSIEERIKEAMSRHNFINDKSEEIMQTLKRTEITVFQYSWMTPSEINNKTINPYLRRIEDFKIQSSIS